ncbi:hypothetical protein EAI_10463, partial [Harpegnathos saltator]
EECFANHADSAGKIEVDAVQEMFLRSKEKFGVTYVNYIGDCDSKTYKVILDLNPYGDDVPVLKNECAGYVEKRMGTLLGNNKKTKKFGGKRKLTDILIKKLTIQDYLRWDVKMGHPAYYESAIRRNVHSVAEMKEAIMALDHLCSTNE